MFEKTQRYLEPCQTDIMANIFGNYLLKPVNLFLHKTFIDGV